MLLTSQAVLWGERGERKHKHFLSLSVIGPCWEWVWRARACAEPLGRLSTVVYLYFLT